VRDGGDLDAREAIALGSVYGGLCLGPVNTAAVHALSYPLGGAFHITHGLANAILLPHVLEFNLSAAPERYACIAKALGSKGDVHPIETARQGVQTIRELMDRCDLKQSLRDVGVPQSALPDLAKAAMTVSRLLKNNPRVLTQQDAETIYRNAYC
jgi:alcohol dehydrogenase class IV